MPERKEIEGQSGPSRRGTGTGGQVNRAGARPVPRYQLASLILTLGRVDRLVNTCSGPLPPTAHTRLAKPSTAAEQISLSGRRREVIEGGPERSQSGLATLSLVGISGVLSRDGGAGDGMWLNGAKVVKKNRL